MSAQTLHDDDDFSHASSSNKFDEAAITAAIKCASHKKKKEVKELLNVAEKEDKAATWLRLVLLVVLAVTAVGVSVVVYMYTHSDEVSDFAIQFSSAADKIFEEIGTKFDLTMGAADTFVVNMVSHAKKSGEEWPFVTLPEFGIQAAKVLSQSTAFTVGFAPLIMPGQQRLLWENYTKDNDGWVEENLDVMSRDPNFHGPILEEYYTSYEIFDYSGQPVPYNLTRALQPNWQTYPTVPYYPPFNWDFQLDKSYGDKLLQAMYRKAVVLTRANNLVEEWMDEDMIGLAEGKNAWAKDFISEEEDPSEPMAEFYYPVIPSTKDIKIDTTSSDLEMSVGVLAFSFYWRKTITHILPENAFGIIVVFQNSCNQTYTYRLDGAEATFLGAGDRHDTNYDHMGISASLTDHFGRDTMYTGLLMDLENSCIPNISIYPSQDTEAQYVNSDPIIYSVVAAMIFVFTSALFLLYDFFVARRQRLITKRALASGAIVSKLFPENVRNQLYQEEEEQEQWRSRPNNDAQAGAFSSPTRIAMFRDRTSTNTVAKGSKPIADLFEETTVFFADLAGFTAWSGKRTPIEVFQLLEALYGVFDDIAKRRNVFKVETIGDCYVAVTGIPNAQPDHAVIMVKFARECMMKMREVINGLVDTLGEDTTALEMRVGLHSGATTAGVLRGDKGRFQLFGDTVNTASRMESNGVKGRIHVSQATADKLVEAGKGRWLTAREDKITAKGKGEMQTFFVSPTSAAKTSISNATTHLSSTNDSSAASLGGDSGVFLNPIEETAEENYATNANGATPNASLEHIEV